ncbi:MAG: hypothetical protein P8099_19290, partial [Gemmatimonadota bacterium]
MSIDRAALRTAVHRRCFVLLAATGTLCLSLATCSRHSPEPVLFVGAAPHLDGELGMDVRPQEVSISPDGRLWLAAEGNIAVGDSVRGTWRHTLYPPFRDDWASARAADFMRPDLSSVSFFTPDTAIATGFGFVAGEYSNTAPYSLLRTVNGGESWDSVSYDMRQVVGGVFTLPDGNAWIGGIHDGVLVHSSDFGATWDSVNPPFASRISSIYMVDTKDGVVGGLWNRLATTRDGGATWTQVPTPFDQGFRAAADSTRERMLEAVALVGNRIVVAQGERVYERRRDGTEWSPLPGVARLFAYDRKRDRMYAVNGGRQVLR